MTTATPDTIICANCGATINEGELFTRLGEHYCEDCFYELFVVCDRCGSLEPRDEAYYCEDTEEIFCADCADEVLVTCAHCGEIHHRCRTIDTNRGRVCNNCRWENFVECCECGELYYIDDAEYCEDEEQYYCSSCWEEHEPPAIHDYYYKPAPIFRGTAPRFLGVELEIDGAGEDNDNARRLLDIAGEDIYCKHDGSLDEGFEIVSQPCSLWYHSQLLPWAEILQEASKMGYRSHDAGTCGLHVHVSRLAFGNTYEAQESAIARVLYFVEHNWEQMLRFSRRTQYQLDRWARRYDARHEDTPAELLKKAKDSCDRYRAVNLTPTHTIEFRLFRGTLNATTFYATLELVDTLCEYCINTTDEKALTWHKYRQTIDQYDSLVMYLNKRGI